MPEQFDAAYWEARYHSHPGPGSRPPGPQLVAEVGQLPPGTALDAGCGEGSNAIWLAEHGWRVIAMDVSPTALRRARESADRRGPGVAGRVDWIEADLERWTPQEQFDLVTAHYVHLTGSRHDLLRRLGAAVTAGGTLLVVDHDHADQQAHATTSVDQMAASLEPERWDIEVAETRVRQDMTHAGQPVTLCDAVLRARKRS